MLIIQGLNAFDVVPQLSQANALLDAPATSEMLIVRATGSSTYSPNTFLDGTYRDMITFSSAPYPTYKIEATSAGSECGTGSLSPGTQLLHVSGQFFISPVPWISRNSFNTDIVVNALPALGTSQTTMSLHIWMSYRILFFISINVDLTNKSAGTPTNTLPWDGAPGGTENVQDQAGSRIPNTSYQFGPFFNLSSHATYAGDFCFVPTVSALDVTTINATALASSYVGGISPTDPVRVANFIAQEKYLNGPANSYNQSHPRFTARNSQWMYNEMENPVNNNLNCSNDCSTSYTGLLNGPSQICSGGTFTITNLPTGAAVTWYSGNTGALSIDTNTGVATRLGNYNGTVSVSATVTYGSCSPAPVTPVSVSLGAGVSAIAFSDMLVYNISTTCYHVQGQYTMVPFSTQYDVYLDNVFLETNTPNTTTGFDGPAGTCNRSHTVRVDATSVCGDILSGSTSYFVSSSQCSSGNCRITTGPAKEAMIIYPNPASSSLTIQVTDSLSTGTDEDSLESPYHLNILDRYSRKVFSVQSSAKTLEIPVGNLPPDIYYLNLMYKGAVIQKQIVISK